ncbi:MAG: VWA domain-containing protein [Chitinivibrionales bacterium]|nr:VWA domain-containing protein [Chitinivibrionales bacterium]
MPAKQQLRHTSRRSFLSQQEDEVSEKVNPVSNLFSGRKRFYYAIISSAPIRWYLLSRFEIKSNTLKGGSMLFNKTQRWCLFALALLTILIARASLQAHSFPVHEIEGPVCVVKDSILGIPVTLSPQNSKYNVIVTDGLAHVTLTQRYINPFPNVNDIVFVFPLPHEGAVHAMSMEYDSMLYKAEIMEKQVAQQKYDSTVSAGGIAALLLQNRPNVFQQRLANIAQGDTAYVKVELSMPMIYHDDVWELSIPTMVAERYQSSGTSPVPPSGSLWNPPANIGGQRLEINVLIQTGFPVSNLTSPTHPLNITQVTQSTTDELVHRSLLRKDDVLDMPYNHRGILHSSQTYPNSDFVLRFSRMQASSDYSLASFYDPGEAKGYFALNLFPDDSLFTGARPELEIILLIDISGSQSGWPLAKEKEICNSILDRLQARDRFTVLSFNTGVTWGFGDSNPREANAANIQKARSFIQGLSAGGGTDLLAGVQASLGVPMTGEHQRYFVFLTDGFITNEQAIFSAIKNHSSQPTVFTFGAGNNLNKYFLDEAAKIGNGYSTKITHNESVGPPVALAWKKIESPQLSNISVEFSGTGISDIIMPNGNTLFVGSPVTMYAAYTTAGRQKIIVKGYREGNPVSIEYDIDLAYQSNTNRVIPKIWARQLISQLSIDQGATHVNRNQIIELSLAYQVLSDYTAFLAINPVKIDEYNNLHSYFATPVEIDKTVVNASLRVVVAHGMLTLYLPDQANLIKLQVYDLMGRLIYTLNMHGVAGAQIVKWDGILQNGSRLKAGKYILRITTSTRMLPKTFTWK